MDLNVDTSWEIKLFELINCAGSRVNDIEEALVCAHFKLVCGLFVHVNRAVHGELLNPSGQRNRASNFSSSTLSCLNNLDSGAIDCPMVKCAKANADFLIHDEKYLV